MLPKGTAILSTFSLLPSFRFTLYNKVLYRKSLQGWRFVKKLALCCLETEVCQTRFPLYSTTHTQKITTTDKKSLVLFPIFSTSIPTQFILHHEFGNRVVAFSYTSLFAYKAPQPHTFPPASCLPAPTPTPHPTTHITCLPVVWKYIPS
jgi:hypothetical protein